MRARTVLATLVLIAAGCGGDPAGGAGDGGGSDAGIAAPAAPMPPAAPVLTPCPPGWREQAIEGGPTICEPWAGDAAPDCADTELAIPGIGCQAIDACPADGWPAGLPDTGVIYVRPDATDGDGSRDRPYATLTAAIAIASSRGATTIALSVGEHAGGGVLRDVDLRGACASGTVLRDPRTASDAAALEARGRVHVEGVRAIGAFRGLWLWQDAQVTARDVILEGPGAGLRLDSRASFEGERVRIVGSATRDTGAYAPFAVWLRPASTLTLRSATLIGGARGAIGTWAGDGDPVPIGATVTVEDSAILDVLEGITGPLGPITVRRTAIERATFGVLTWAGTTTELADVRARDLRVLAGHEDLGSALAVAIGGTLRADRVAVSRSEIYAVIADEAAQATIHDLVVDRTVVGSLPPYALHAGSEGTRIEVARAHFAEVAGIVARGDSGGTVIAEDLTIDGFARALDADEIVSARSGTVTVTRARGRALGTGVWLATGGGSLTISDLDAEGGRGVIAQCPAASGGECLPGVISTLALERVRLRSVVELGVVVEHSRGTLADVSIEGVSPLEGRGGLGLFVFGACEGERISVRDVALQGVFGAGDGTTLTLRDLAVDGVRTVPCAAGECSGTVGGDGIACALGATVSVERARAGGAERGGITVVDRCASATIASSSVSENEIGVLVDDEVAPPVLVDVAVRGNNTDFNTLDVAVPVPGGW